MNDLANRIFECEREFELTSSVLQFPWGKYYYDKNNELRNDSNHAKIYVFDNLDAAFEDILNFHNDIGATPRIMSGFAEGEFKKLLPYFEKYGFSVDVYDDLVRYYFCKGNDNVVVDLDFKVYNTYVAEEIEEVFSEAEKEYIPNDIKNILDSGLGKFFIGYKGNVPVCYACTAKYKNGFTAIAGVCTIEAHRKNGYARQLVRFMTDYLISVGDRDIYLVANDLSAKKIYEEAGFKEIKITDEPWFFAVKQ